MASNDRRYEPWTEEDLALMGRLIDAGRTSREIAEVLGRSEHTVNQARRKFGFVKRPENCEHCGGPIAAVTRHGPGGRPRRFCTNACREADNIARKTAERATLRQAEIERRTDWGCGYCGKPLPRDNPRRVFCGDACAKRVWYLRVKDQRHADRDAWQTQQDT